MVLLKTLVNLWYLEGTLERLGASASYVELTWMSKEWRQSSKLLAPKSFDACKNAAVPIILMLGHSEIDMKVLDAGIEATESNNCIEMSRDNRDANDVLAMI